MKQEIPKFQEGAILRAKTLETLRNYSYNFNDLSRKQYSNGILSGMELSSSVGFLQVDTGLFILNHQIFYLDSPWKIPCKPSTEQVLVKLRLKQSTAIKNAQEYDFDIILDEKVCGVEEFELCRFQLQEGASLRDKYLDFFDISTEYDTINLQYTQYAAYGRPSFHPKVLHSFAEEMLVTNAPREASFCLQLLSRHETVDFSAIVAFLRLQQEPEPKDLSEAYHGLCRVLSVAKEEKTATNTRQKPSRPQILID